MFGYSKSIFGCLLTILIFISSLYALPILTEAEDGILDSVSTYTSVTGFSGSGYVGNFSKENSSLSVNVTILKASGYNISVIYYSPEGYKEQSLFINGAFSGNVVMKQGDSFDTASVGGYWLDSGENTISVKKSWGYAYVDAFILEPRAKNIYAPVESPIDTLATDETVDLYRRIRNSYGKKIISGIHDQRVNMSGSYENFDKLVTIAGVKPLLRSFDFSDYSTLNPWLWKDGKHVLGYIGDQSRETEGIIDWYNSTDGKGIIEITWHWHSPIADSAGVNNFLSDKTSFDVRQAVISGTQENKKILEDIDSISAQMRRLSELKIPVLWRPLHEAGGGWFWWGAHGAGPALKLWNILYDRMVNHNNLHNMIWIWSTPEKEWYPGNDKVDILGFDSYPGAFEYGSQKSMFDHMYDLSGGKKMVAMSETGPIPNINTLFTEDAGWAWWSTWADLTFTNNDTAHIKSVFANPFILDMNNTSDMIFNTEKPKQYNSVPFQLKKTTCGIEIKSSKRVCWKLYSISGRIVKSGTDNFINFEGLSSGTYGIKINGYFNERIFIKR